jgi:hypothetical protein
MNAFSQCDNSILLIFHAKIDLQSGKRDVVASITGQTFFGVRHGLETLAQLVDFDSELKYLQVETELKI